MNTSKPNIPHFLKEIKIKNFHGIKDLSININEEEVPQWIFLTGKNGYGKTSILQAITAGFVGGVDNRQILLDDKEYIEVLLLKNGESQMNFVGLQNEVISENSIKQKRANFEQKTKDSEVFIPFLNFAAYGSSRLNKQNGRIDFEQKESSPTYSLRKTDGKLFDIEWDLKLWYKRNDEKYQQSKKIMLELLHPYIDDIDVILNPPYKTVKYHETNSPENDWISYDEMAAGYKNIVAMFGDMIIRLKKHSDNEINSLSDISGIVLIDEFELHLHPKWQRKLVEKLTNLFPKIQFIASTHSPIPLLGAPPEKTVILNVDRTKEEGITVRRLKELEKELKYLTPNLILDSAIFNYSDLLSVANKSGDDIYTEETRKELVENKERKQRLKSKLSPEKKKELLKLLNLKDDEGE